MGGIEGRLESESAAQHIHEVRTLVLQHLDFFRLRRARRQRRRQINHRALIGQ